MSGTTGNSSLPVDSAEKSVTRFNAENCLTQHAAILRAPSCVRDNRHGGIAASVPNEEIL
jgi:hypothetical protein